MGRLDLSNSTSSLGRRATQQDAPWPLYQISASTKAPTDKTYYYLDDISSGVDIYIMDSGINHPLDEFKDDNGNDRIQDVINTGDESDFADSSGAAGHGTSVAAAIGGRTHGVAKSANLLNVKHKVGGLPRSIRVTKALEQILARHKKRRTQSGFKGSVINMSFGLAFDSPLVRDAIKAAYEGGISLVASGGNDKYEPDHFPSIIDEVIAVGASDINYVPAIFSNFGASPITDIWAPGENVPLILKDGTEATCRGTSFAAAFTSGIISIFYGEEGINMNPTLATTRLLAQTDDWIDLAAGQDWKGSPHAFANSGNRKGAEARPPLKYIGGEKVDVATASPSPTNSPTPSPTPPTPTTPTPTPSDVCGDSYHFLYDNFEIHGKNFNATQIGEDGSELKKTIESKSYRSFGKQAIS
jgi:cerevisin